MSSKYPSLVTKLCLNFDAWIVGSAANPDNTNPPRDYDVLVPFSNWGPASQLIPNTARINSCGGFKVVSDGVEVDVWPGELGFVMRQSLSRWAFHPSSGVRLVVSRNLPHQKQFSTTESSDLPLTAKASPQASTSFSPKVEKMIGESLRHGKDASRFQ